MASPLEIKIALHYWALTNDYEDHVEPKHGRSPAVQDALARFVAMGLLVDKMQGSEHRCDRRYDSGPALECFVDALCSVPWPKQKWVIE